MYLFKILEIPECDIKILECTDTKINNFYSRNLIFKINLISFRFLLLVFSVTLAIFLLLTSKFFTDGDRSEAESVSSIYFILS